MSHPNLLSYVGANVRGNALYVVTEYHEGGDLRQLLMLEQVPLSWHVRVKILLEASRAVEHLHSRSILHRDIKTQNIVLSRHLNVILCDFGFARSMDVGGKSTTAMTLCGTDEFMAPEIMFGTEYGLSADIFSMGIVACEVICRKIPGDKFLSRLPKDSFAVDMNEIMNNVACGSKDDTVPSSLIEWTTQCCSYTEDDRPKAKDATAWLQELYDELSNNGSSNKLPVYVGGKNNWAESKERPNSGKFSKSLKGSSAASLAAGRDREYDLSVVDEGEGLEKNDDNEDDDDRSSLSLRIKSGELKRHHSAKLPREFSASLERQISNSIVVENIIFGKLLGAGNFSQVFDAIYNGKRVAVKKQELHEKNLDKYMARELDVLKTTVHPHLICYVGATLVDDVIYIVTEFMDGGDLRNLMTTDLKDKTNHPNGLWKCMLQILLDATSALAYLHDRELMHRDIKTQNIVLDGQLRAVLCDFGFARNVSSSKQTAMTLCGTDEFMAPEIIFGMEYGLSADVFSMGIVACEMCCRKAPDETFMVRTPQKSFGLDMEEVKNAFCGEPPSSLVMWIEQCCTYEPDERLNAVDAEGWLEDLLVEIPDDDAKLVLGKEGWKVVGMEQNVEQEASKVGKIEKVSTIPAATAPPRAVDSPSELPPPPAIPAAQNSQELPTPECLPPSIIESKDTTTTATPSKGETKTTTSTTSSTTSSSQRKKKKQANTLCTAPGCDVIHRHETHFCPLHNYLRRFEHVMYSTKRGYNWPKSWQRRFFCLDKTALYYYKTMDSVKNGGEPKGIIQLSDLLDRDWIDTVCDKVIGDRFFCLRLHTAARTFYFQFDTDSERMEFIEAIKRCV
jgi:serine/threonine protein kinase